MLFDYFSDINWLAVLVATLAYFVLGAIWYSNALFGRQYRAAIGVGDESATPDPMAMVVNFAGWLVAAVALALIAAAAGASTVLDGIVLGLVTSFGFIGTNRIVSQYYEGRNKALMQVNAPYTLLGYMIMGVIISVWN